MHCGPGAGMKACPLSALTLLLAVSTCLCAASLRHPNQVDNSGVVVFSRPDYSGFGLEPVHHMIEDTFARSRPTTPFEVRHWRSGIADWQLDLWSEMNSAVPPSLVMYISSVNFTILRDLPGNTRATTLEPRSAPLNLTDFFVETNLFDDVPRAMLDGVRSFNDPSHTSMVPFFAIMYALTCQEDVFRPLYEAGGFDLNGSRPRVLFSDFVDVLRRVRDAGAVPLDFDSDSALRFATVSLSAMYGADLVKQVGRGNVSFADPRLREWGAFLQLLHDERLAVTTPADTAAASATGGVCSFGIQLGSTPGHVVVPLPTDYDLNILSSASSSRSSARVTIEEVEFTRGKRTAMSLSMYMMIPSRVENPVQSKAIISTYINAVRSGQVPGAQNYFDSAAGPTSGNPVVAEIYNLDGMVESLESLMIPAFGQRFVKVFSESLFHPDPAVTFSASAMLDALEPIRVEVIFGAASAPLANPGPGSYVDQVTVTLSSATVGAGVLFTIDGSDPLTAGLLYSAPITITHGAASAAGGTVVLRAVAYASGLVNSGEVVFTYAVAAPSDGSTLAYVIIGVVVGIVLVAAGLVALALLRRRALAVPEFAAEDITLHTVIGVGSRGLVFAGTHRGMNVAVKLFLPKSDMNAILAQVKADEDAAAEAGGKVRGGSGTKSNKDTIINITDEKGSDSSLLPGAVPNSSTPQDAAAAAATTTKSTAAAATLKGALRGVSIGAVGGAAATSSRTRSRLITGEGALLNNTTLSTLSTQMRGSGGSRTGSSTRREAADLAKLYAHEVATLSQLRSPHLVAIYGTTKLPGGVHGIVMELVDGGSVYDLVHNGAARLGRKKALEIALGTARGLAHLHAHEPPIIHRDVKSLNVLRTARGDCKVSDFDLAIRADADGGGSGSRSGKKNGAGSNKGPYSTSAAPRHRSANPGRKAASLGTVPWTAPEVFSSGGETTSTAADVFSFGVMVWELFSRQDPHEGRTAEQVREFVTKGGVLELPDTAGDDIADLVGRCCGYQAQDRPTMESIVEELTEMWMDAPEEVRAEDGRSVMCASAVLGQDTVRAMQKELLAGSLPAPVTVDEIGIVFTDIVGFTKFSSQMEPSEVASLLARLFSSFDGVLKQHGGVLYKTIGDAYIALVPGRNAAMRAVAIATDMVDVANNTRRIEDTKALGGETVSIRAGVHVGPAAAQASDVATIEFVGDAVNLCSRLESMGTPSMVHASEEIVTAIRSHPDTATSYSVVPRPPMEVKGKGLLNTFFVKRNIG